MLECHGVLWGVSWGEVSRDAVGCGGVGYGGWRESSCGGKDI